MENSDSGSATFRVASEKEAVPQMDETAGSNDEEESHKQDGAIGEAADEQAETGELERAASEENVDSWTKEKSKVDEQGETKVEKPKETTEEETEEKKDEEAAAPVQLEQDDEGKMEEQESVKEEQNEEQHVGKESDNEEKQEDENSDAEREEKKEIKRQKKEKRKKEKKEKKARRHSTSSSSSSSSNEGGEVANEGKEEEAKDGSLPPEAEQQLRDAGVAAEQCGIYYSTFQRLEQGRGHVTQEDMYTALQLLGQCPQSREQVAELLQQHQLDGHKQLSMRDFADFCVNICRPREEVLADLRASFRVFDADGSGFLDREELRRALFGASDSAVGEGDGGHEDFEELAQLADTNGDGKIDCAEFCRLVTMGISEMRQEAARRAGESSSQPTGS